MKLKNLLFGTILTEVQLPLASSSQAFDIFQAVQASNRFFNFRFAKNKSIKLILITPNRSGSGHLESVTG